MAEAYVTLATNDTYALGALVLAHSLKSVKTSKQLCVLITPDVSLEVRSKLEDVYNNVVTVNILDSNDSAHLSLMKRPELGITLTKLHCWSLIQYTKCVFLDADILAMQNADELFDQPELSGCCDVGWPDCFNSGMFVFSPSMETYAKLLTHAEGAGSFDGGDQGLLNTFFTNWNRVSFIYNMVSSATYTYLPAYKQYGKDVKFVHFLGAVKPWHQRYQTESGTVEPRPGHEHVAHHLNTWWGICTSFVQPEMSQEVYHGPINPFRSIPQPPQETAVHTTNFTTNTHHDIPMQVHESYISPYPSMPSPTLQLDAGSFPLSPTSILIEPHVDNVVCSFVYKGDSNLGEAKCENRDDITIQEQKIDDLNTEFLETHETVVKPRDAIVETRDTIVDLVEVSNKVCIEREDESPPVAPEVTSGTQQPIFIEATNKSYDQFSAISHDQVRPMPRNYNPVLSDFTTNFRNVSETPFRPLMNSRMPSPYSTSRPAALSQSADKASELCERMIGLDLSKTEMQESKQRWENGIPDYLGTDSFENIQAFIDAKLDSSN